MMNLLKKIVIINFPKKYDWDFIVKQYLEVFHGLTNYQNK